MKRKIVNIDEEKCTGCGACAEACHEGAIAMIDGKARLIRDDYCDGLGDCLPECPAGAISIIEREAQDYDRAAVEKHMAENRRAEKACPTGHAGHGCPGSMARTILRDEQENSPHSQNSTGTSSAEDSLRNAPASRLQNWLVQIKLAPVHAPYFENANLLVAADCTAYAYARFHEDFIKNRVALIGCPKLDDTDYSEKLSAILEENSIKSLTIVRMEVPCCGGIEYMATEALKQSGKFIPWRVVTISVDGQILDE